MKLKKGMIVAVILSFITLVGCSEEVNSNKLKITGDIENTLEVDIKEYETEKIELEEESVDGVKLNTILEGAITTSDYDVYISSFDDVGVLLKGKELDEVYIGYNIEDKYRVYTNTHSINANIKNIEEVIVISNENNLENSVNIISESENILSLTPGNLTMKEATLISIEDGKSINKVNDKEYESNPYRKRELYSIERLIDKKINNNLLVIGKDGKEAIMSKDSYLEVRDNKIDCVDLEDRISVQDIAGIIIDPPKDSIKRLYSDIKSSLEEDRKVLAVYIDGLSEEVYEKYKENLFISSGEKVTSTTRYVPVTNVGFATMITGESVDIHGVLSRKFRELNCDSIFKTAVDMNKETYLVEGTSSILNTEVEPILNPDKNNNDSTDDEVFNTSMKYVDNSDFLFVHFHGLDDYGHRYSPKNKKTIEKLYEIDNYIKELSENFVGDLYIVSDHGMHTVGEEGSHGEFRYEDMFVPYIKMEVK